jgi:hypothetical protein
VSVEAWKALKEIITTSADITLGKIERVEHNYWFDAECGHMRMIKNELIEECSKGPTPIRLNRNTTWPEEKKRGYIKQGRRNIMSVNLKNCNISGPSIKS